MFVASQINRNTISIFSDYAEPGVATIGQKVGSTFRPSSDEGYTTPFAFSHYDTPGNLPEYAEPLPPEPEYATPFSEQPSEHNLPTLTGIVHCSTHGPPVPAPSAGTRTTSSRAQYDCPSHRMLSNGYCTPALHVNGPRPVSVVYAEPKSCDSLLRKHTYEEPLWTQKAHTWRKKTPELKCVLGPQEDTKLDSVVQRVLMLTELNFQWAMYPKLQSHFITMHVRGGYTTHHDLRAIWTQIFPSRKYVVVQRKYPVMHKEDAGSVVSQRYCLLKCLITSCTFRKHIQRCVLQCI